MSKYNSEWVKSNFDRFGIKEWERWDANLVQQIKLEVHLHYLRKYLHKNEYTLEIGAGAGRFTQQIAHITNRLVVADISPVQLELNKQQSSSLGYASSIQQWVECDVCDLHPHFADQTFDSIVCYGGPLSYVFEERERAISELLRVIKPGGFLLLSVMSLWGTMHNFLPEVMHLDNAINKEIIMTGDLDPDRPEAGSHFCHMYRASEFRDFLEKAGTEIVEISASDCLTSTWAESLIEIRKDEASWKFLLEMEIEACKAPGCLDMGTHLIAICKKLS